MNAIAADRSSFCVKAVAPIRICDLGGWTDTWFAEHGVIFNIAVAPYAEVQLQVFPPGARPERIVINAADYAERYAMTPGAHWGRRPLLEAAIESMRLPDELCFEATIHCEAPAGASTGTSAAVCVALIGALDCLTLGRMTPYEIALAAHSVETVLLGQQSGIQDQVCSAYGAINYIVMTRYPQATVAQLALPDRLWWELERRLALIYLGNSHNSSQVHEMVIRGLENAGGDCRQLEDLRETAPRARAALLGGDLAGLGEAMRANTEAQRRLHPALVSAQAQRVIEIARAHGALGWKVNGAGGEGGSLTLLCGPRSDAKRAMLREIEQENPLFRRIPIRLSRLGLSARRLDKAPGFQTP